LVTAARARQYAIVLRQTRNRTPWTVAVVAVILLGACGSSGKPSTSSPSSLSSELRGKALYCRRAKEFLATSNVDTSSARSIIEGLDRAAVAYRRLGEVAPTAVKGDIDRLASSAEYLVRRLRQLAPVTMQEFDAAQRKATAEMNARYGDLDREAERVKAFASRTCGVDG
jgi:hypothetical protein